MRANIVTGAARDESGQEEDGKTKKKKRCDTFAPHPTLPHPLSCNKRNICVGKLGVWEQPPKY